MMAAESKRPLLLPQNRRLRHLQGVSIRNFSITKPSGITIDDATFNKTPEKLQAIREQGRDSALHSSQSSDDINTQIRPRAARRRSSLWAAQTPQFRQKKLEDVINSGLVDSFFTLHAEGENDPIYISEIHERQMNPNYQSFDLTSHGPTVTRQPVFTIKMWIKRHPVDPSTSSSYTLFIEQAFSLPSLTYLGTLLDRSFAPNTVILHLIDGPYALDLSPATTQQPSKPASAVPTSSYSTLMRLSSLDDSIQDALASREKLASQINDILEKQTIDQDLTIARQKVDLTQKYIERQTLLVSQARKKLSEKQMSIVARRQGITSAQAAQERTKPVLFEAETETIEGQKRLLLAREGMRGQLRRICEELLQAFPIEPTAKTLLFTIAGLHIPNSNFLDSSIPEEEISAALGHVALVVHTLSHYLAVALPYPIEWFGSRSIIRDEISLLNDPNRIFPLFSKGSIQFRFEYAVFLLNKDIEALVEKSSLKVQDIRLTLPNLKYLLFCLSAGTEELPLRKAGGIRGLIGGGSLRGTPNVSRRGSEDETPRLGSKGRENGRVDAAADLRRTLGSGLVFSDEPGLSLRTKGLRENRS